MTQAYAIGQGFDIFGSYTISSTITPLFNVSKAGKKEWMYDGVTYSIPTYIQGIENTEDNSETQVCSTREDFQNAIAARAKVAAGYGAFSGHMQAAFEQQIVQSSAYDFAYRIYNSTHAMLTWMKEEMPSYVTDTFRASVATLPSSLDNLSPFAAFFQQFGIYFVSSLQLGGSLEYYASVNKYSGLSKEDISLMISADYKGVFVTGSVSGGIKDTSEWKQYSSNRSVNIMVKGGDDDFRARLEAADPDAPDLLMPQNFVHWVTSLKKAPAIVGFRLSGIWELCGEKEQLVQQAFELLQPYFRPQISIETFFLLQDGVPIITLTGEGSPLAPPIPPQFRSGYQVIVFDRMNLTKEGIRLNKYYSFDINSPETREEWRFLYQAMQADLEIEKLLNPQYLVILASFGLPNNAGPTPEHGYPLFRSLGGTSQSLQMWIDVSDFGSAWWEACVYILVGIPGLGAESAIDYYVNQAIPFPKEGPVNLSVDFYWSGPNSRYTFGLSSQPSWPATFVSQLEFYKQASCVHAVAHDSIQRNGASSSRSLSENGRVSIR